MRNLCFCVLFMFLFSSSICAKGSDRTTGPPIPVLGEQNSSFVDITLEDSSSVNNITFLKQFELLANCTVRITIDYSKLSSPQKYFFFLQVHSFLNEVVISETLDYATGYVTIDRGTNIGKIFLGNETGAPSNRTVFLTNELEQKTASIMIVVLMYEVDKTAIPGACKHQPPTLNTTTQEDVISFTFSPGKLPASDSCELDLSTAVAYDIRFVYSGKNEYSVQVYFDTIKRMLVGSNAITVGEAFNGKIDSNRPFQRMFSRYAGMGLFFVVILRAAENDSFIPISYVPSVSYGCPGPVNEEIHCDLIDNTAWKVVYVLIMLVGIGIMIFGRGILFIRATVYSFMIAGFLIYTVHCMVPFGGVAKLTVAIGLGIVLTATWIRTLLRCHAIYRLTDFMAAIILGYTFACVILFGTADAGFLVNSVNYFLLLATGVLLITLWYFSLLAVCGVIIMNVMVGSCFIVLTLLFIFDGNLQYAFVNNWRRIRDNDFRYALIFPHMEVVDWISVVLWVVIFAFGLCFQRKCKCIDNRPHNPMPRIFRDPEQRPLIARLTSSGDSNDVFLSPRSNSAFLNSLSQRGNR